MLDRLRQEKHPEDVKPEPPEETASPKPEQPAEEKKPLPERQAVSVAVRRQQRRRAAGNPAARAVPVRRQAADAAKRQRTGLPARTEQSAQAEPSDKAEPPKEKRSILRDAAFGAILLIFAGIGVYALAQHGITAVRERNNAQNAAVTQCILPLCVMDMPSFEKPDDLTDEQFLTAAVWAMITDGRLADYPTETNLCTVPAADVTAAGNARFGTARKPEYRTVGFTDAIRFYYDADQDSYLLPADPRYFGNLPEVQSCKEQNGVYTVTAVCRPEQPQWYQTEAPVTRHAEFKLKQTGGTWQIVSLHTDAPDAQKDTETEPTQENEDD